MNNQNRPRPKRFLLTLTLLVTTVIGCFASKDDRAIREVMHDAERVASELFNYVWNKQEFRDPDNKEKIASLLVQLSDDFHNVKKITPTRALEPGFKIALEVNRELISDARRQFLAGNIGYAEWRLKGLTENCVSCHSRFSASRDFSSDTPLVEDSSMQSKLAVGEFLVATRQFSKASDYLYSLAETAFKVEGGRPVALQALELWLVVEVRVKQQFLQTKENLAALQDAMPTDPNDPLAEMLSAWRDDLSSLPAMALTKAPLYTARELLSPFLSNDVLVSDEDHLVSTLYASVLLHKLLLQPNIDSESKRRATYLLAVSYLHMPLDSFDVYRALYLEQCIREFPRTFEAQKAFRLYKDYLVEQSSGSGGTHLEPEDEAKLKELETLAFREPPKAI